VRRPSPRFAVVAGRRPRCRCAGATALVGEGGDLAETVLFVPALQRASTRSVASSSPSCPASFSRCASIRADKTLTQPEWHDTLDVPKAVCRDDPSCPVPPTKIIDTIPGSITFRTYFNPVTVGCFVAHCHIINHEDIGMMQRFDVLPAKGQPSGCMLDEGDRAAALIKSLKRSFQICSAPQQ
jgi:FtsP/CotA-like multicopper oxidase with cupredoxin domain